MREFWNGVLWGMGFREAAPKKRKCRFCGRQIPADSRYCPYCGKRLKLN
ncbi:zinc-ribbon domain-containing protein [Candidatus Bathyarchaeota archaeon]|nr:zinc-ribbon domain-containing protein [Candidatus Bathyarchaeota archaeon]